MLNATRLLEQSLPPQLRSNRINSQKIITKSNSPIKHNNRTQSIEKSPGNLYQTKSPKIPENFGKIIKQKPKNQDLPFSTAPCQKENSQNANILVLQNQAKQDFFASKYLTHRDISNSPKIIGKNMKNESPKYKHLDMLIEKQEKSQIKEPFDRFIFTILKRGRADFEEKLRKNGNSEKIYKNILSELNDQNSDILISNNKPISEISKRPLNPHILQEILSKIQIKRWYKLYLVKIYYKKSLVPIISELFILQENYRNNEIKNIQDLRKFLRFKFLLTKKVSNCDKDSKKQVQPNLKPFICGTNATTKRKITKTELAQQNIEDLQIKYQESTKIYEKSLLNVFFLIKLIKIVIIFNFKIFANYKERKRKKFEFDFRARKKSNK